MGQIKVRSLRGKQFVNIYNFKNLNFNEDFFLQKLISNTYTNLGKNEFLNIPAVSIKPRLFINFYEKNFLSNVPCLDLIDSCFITQNFKLKEPIYFY